LGVIVSEISATSLVMAAIVRTMTAIGSAINAIVSALYAIVRAMHAILRAIVEMGRAMYAMRAILCAMRAIVNAMPQWPQCAMQCTLGRKSRDPCFHVFLMEARVMTFATHCIPISGVLTPSGETAENFGEETV